MKEFKVFFSWQADLPSNQTKRFIEESLEIAKDLLSDTIDLIPDEATREKFGSPDIMNSIFEKIDDCDLFVADVSIVGNYTIPPVSEDDEPQAKYFSNPNVLLELGYAAANKTWDRCICFANTKYGDVKNLPFDLNHRRITAFSYSNGERQSELKRMAEIIAATVREYIDKPLAKKDFSLHLVGSYNFETRSIEKNLIPYNQYAISLYNDKSQALLDEIMVIIDKISEIHLPLRKNSNIDIDATTENMTYGEVMKNPLLAKEFSLKLMNLHDVKVDHSFIKQEIGKYFDIALPDDFCDLSGLQKSSLKIPFSSPSLEGTEQEKAKYDLLLELESKLTTIDLREMFLHLFDNICIIPLAIKNISTKSDERITINIKVTKGIPIQPTAKFFDQDFSGLEGCIYEEHLVEELLKLKENGDITYDNSYSREKVEPYIPKFHMPRIDAFGYASEPEYDAEDYENELQEYVQSISASTQDEYSFSIGALRPNETVWLDKVMLIQPVEGIIAIKYTIKSNKSNGELFGDLKYCLC